MFQILRKFKIIDLISQVLANKNIFSFIIGSVLFLFSDLSWSGKPCEINTDSNIHCASFWTVKFATRQSSINYIWIVFLACTVISLMLAYGALSAFKHASDGGQGAGLKKPLTLLALSGCMMSLPFISKVMVNFWGWKGRFWCEQE